MTSRERKRSSLSSASAERPSRAMEPRSRDSGASTQITRGAGQRDEVGHSGIYPVGSDDVPAGADVRTPAEFGRSRRRKESR